LNKANEWMKYDKSLAPLRRVIKQKNFDISKIVKELEAIAPDGLTAFTHDLEEIEQFLDSIHEHAIREAMNDLKKAGRKPGLRIDKSQKSKQI
jgi:hypothetical protein